LYGFDASYAVEVGAAYPDKFGLVKPVERPDRTLPTSWATGQQ